jgi:hypothetical protein
VAVGLCVCVCGGGALQCTQRSMSFAASAQRRYYVMGGGRKSVKASASEWLVKEREQFVGMVGSVVAPYLRIKRSM